MTALERPQPRHGVLSIQAYVPGKSGAPGVAKVHKLSSNETPLGASPQAIQAYLAEAQQLHDYPDGSAPPRGASGPAPPSAVAPGAPAPGGRGGRGGAPPASTPPASCAGRAPTTCS